MEFLMPVFVEAVLPLVGTVVSALVAWGLFELKKFVAQKTTSAAVNDAVAHIAHTTETVVKKMEQTVVANIKDMAADGKMDKAEVKRALSQVKENAMFEIRAQVPAAIQTTAGMAVNSLTQLISDKIEAVKLENKMLAPIRLEEMKR